MFGLGASNVNKDALDHAWNWFEYHANQRMMMIRFYLVVAGAIATGAGYLLLQKQYFLSGSLSIYGALISYCFLRLDTRVKGLVKLGEDALKGEQKKFADSLSLPAFEICKHADNVRNEKGERLG